MIPLGTASAYLAFACDIRNYADNAAKVAATARAEADKVGTADADHAAAYLNAYATAVTQAAATAAEAAKFMAFADGADEVDAAVYNIATTTYAGENA